MNNCDAGTSFKSKKKDHALQRNEKIDIMFELICLLAKNIKPAEYLEYKEKWNKEKSKDE